MRHVPFDEKHVLLIVITSVKPGWIHCPMNEVEIEQDDERPEDAILSFSINFPKSFSISLRKYLILDNDQSAINR